MTGLTIASILETPIGVAIDVNQYLFVSDLSLSGVNDRVSKWAPGSFPCFEEKVAVGNIFGARADSFDSPKGIALDGSGNLNVTDNNKYRIQKWAPGVTLLALSDNLSEEDETIVLTPATSCGHLASYTDLNFIIGAVPPDMPTNFSATTTNQINGLVSSIPPVTNVGSQIT